MSAPFSDGIAQRLSSFEMFLKSKGLRFVMPKLSPSYIPFSSVPSVPGVLGAPTVPASKAERAQKKTNEIIQRGMDFLELEKPDMKMTLDKLKMLCKTKGVPVSGNKAQLVGRLTGETPVASSAKPATRKRNAFAAKLTSASAIIKKLNETISSLEIRKNAHGVFVHHDTNIVFDPRTHRAIGVWKSESETVTHLSPLDIAKCQEMSVGFDIPENLEYGSAKINDAILLEELGGDDFKDEGEAEEAEEADDDSEDGEDEDGEAEMDYDPFAQD